MALCSISSSFLTSSDMVASHLAALIYDNSSHTYLDDVYTTIVERAGEYPAPFYRKPVIVAAIQVAANERISPGIIFSA
jgi:hypothetical protein